MGTFQENLQTELQNAQEQGQERIQQEQDRLVNNAGAKARGGRPRGGFRSCAGYKARKIKCEGRVACQRCQQMKLDCLPRS